LIAKTKQARVIASERKSSRRLGKEFKLMVLREAQESGATVKEERPYPLPDLTVKFAWD